MPFGCVAAVISYHRLGNFLEETIRSKFRACIARYVDDFFGAVRRNVFYTGGRRILSRVGRLLGTFCDEAKTADDMVSMVVLGICTTIALESAKILVQVDEGKAERWRQELEESWDQGIMQAALASKFAGRFSFCSSGTSSRTGRTYVRAFCAQANAPCERISPWLGIAMKWWHTFLAKRPPTMLCARTSRKVVRAWTDASGQMRLISAVIMVEEQLWYTATYVKEEIWVQLQESTDHQIGVQEMLAVVLLFETFGEELRDSLLLLWIDNRGVLGALRKGTCKRMEVALAVARMWMRCAELNVDMHTWYVASKSNSGWALS